MYPIRPAVLQNSTNSHVLARSLTPPSPPTSPDLETNPESICLPKLKLGIGLGRLNQRHHSLFVKKACATVSLNNTNATASSASDVMSILEVDNADFRNIIPFPCSPLYQPTIPVDIHVPSSFELDFGIHFSRSPVCSKSTSVAGAGENSGWSSRPIPKRQRSQADIHLAQRSSHMRSNSAPTPSPSQSRKHPHPENGSDREMRSKRPRKTKQLMADLEFGTMVHRSIVWNLHSLSSSPSSPTSSRSSSLSPDSTSTHSPSSSPLWLNLKQHDIELSRRLWNRLRSHGFEPIPLSPPKLRDGIPPPTHAISIDMDIDEETEMDVDSPPSPPTPSSPPSPSFSSSPTSGPMSSPPERTLTPAQLVASLHLRQRGKNSHSNSKTGLKAKCLKGGHLSSEGPKEMVKSPLSRLAFVESQRA